MTDQVDLLIAILFDNEAREDERHDAAMDIGDFDDHRALNALMKIAANPAENEIILDACGESLAQIWVKRNFFDIKAYNQLQPQAQHVAKAYIKTNRPEWLKLL
jgi:hypothetical protein